MDKVVKMNLHCISEDCPNIRFDMAADRYDELVALDAGYSRISCKDCIYKDDITEVKEGESIDY